MRKIKFPLEMAGGRQVRELEEFQEAFDLEKAVEYFSNGKLQKWLENNYNDDILEELEGLTGQEKDFIEQFTQILGVSWEGAADTQGMFERITLKEKLKRQIPEEKLEEIAPFLAGNQKMMEELIQKGCKEIYLVDNQFYLSKDIQGIVFHGIQNPKVCVEAENGKVFRDQKITLIGVLAANEETARVIRNDEWNDIMTELLDTLELAWKTEGK